VVEQVTSLDGKAVRTAWALVGRPGALTADHVTGRRARYLRPLQLFLLVNVLLFATAPRMPLFSYSLRNYLAYAPPSPALVAALVQRAGGGVPAGDGPAAPPELAGVSAGGPWPRDAYVAAFDGRVEAQRKSLIILFAPALALVLRVLFAWRAAGPGVPRRYGEHLVFALHLLAFVWLVFAGWGGVAALANGRVLGGLGSAAVYAAVLGLALATPVYVFLAVRRVYALSPAAALAMTAALAAAFAGLLVAYRGLLFFTTYYTL
jgi:hypothetical protein